MRVVVLLNGAMVADVICGKEAVHIGGREDCRIHLRGAGLPAQLAVAYPEITGAWILKQLDDGGKITINGTELNQTARLESGDEIRIGDFLLRVYPEFDDAPAARVKIGTSQAQLEAFARTKLPPGTSLKKLDEDLTIQPGQLLSIGRSSVGVSGAATVEQLMDAALRLLLETFAAQRAWIGIRRATIGRMEFVEGRMLTGQLIDLPEVGETLQPRVLDRAQFALVPRVSGTERYSAMAGPLIGPAGSLGMLYVDSGEGGRRFELPDLDFFIVQAYLIAHQLDAIFRGMAQSRAAILEGEVSVAHAIQSRLTPRKLPQWKELYCGAFREPGRERAGDIYDVVRLANNLAALLLAQTDVAGALPSMLMTQAQTAFRVAVMHQDTPAVFLRTLNWMLHEGQGDHPVDCFVAAIDPPTGQMRYSVAGRVGACIIDRRGESRRLGATDALPALGVAKSTVYPLLPEQLESRETLAVYSRGISTASNRDGQSFGEERFVNLLCDGFGQPSAALMEDVVADLRSFTAEGSQPDDISLILIHRP